MSYFKRISGFIIIIILSVLIIFLFGCDKNKNSPDNSYDALQAFAVIQNETETEPQTEIISGIMQYSQDKTTENTTINITAAENTEPIESSETSESSENLYVITPSGKKYHYPTCRTVKNIKEYLTKEEAEQMGYEPCKICNPK